MNFDMLPSVETIAHEQFAELNTSTISNQRQKPDIPTSEICQTVIVMETTLKELLTQKTSTTYRFNESTKTTHILHIVPNEKRAETAHIHNAHAKQEFERSMLCED